MSEEANFEFKVQVWKMPEGWWAKAWSVDEVLGIDVVGYGLNPQQALREVAEALATNAKVSERKIMLSAPSRNL